MVEEKLILCLLRHHNFYVVSQTRTKQIVNFIPDRIVVHGREILHGIVPGSAQPFNFKKAFHLSEEEVV